MPVWSAKNPKNACVATSSGLGPPTCAEASRGAMGLGEWGCLGWVTAFGGHRPFWGKPRKNLGTLAQTPVIQNHKILVVQALFGCFIGFLSIGGCPCWLWRRGNVESDYFFLTGTPPHPLPKQNSLWFPEKKTHKGGTLKKEVPSKRPQTAKVFRETGTLANSNADLLLYIVSCNDTGSQNKVQDP